MHNTLHLRIRSRNKVLVWLDLGRKKDRTGTCSAFCLKYMIPDTNGEGEHSMRRRRRAPFSLLSPPILSLLEKGRPGSPLEMPLFCLSLSPLERKASYVRGGDTH